MIGKELDTWEVPVGGRWSVRVHVHEDHLTGHPRDVKDVYNPYAHTTNGAKDSALQALKDWYAQEWTFVRVRVVPILKLENGQTEEFPLFAQEMYSVEWGRMSSAAPEGEDQTWGRDEVTTYPVKDLVEEALGELRRISGLLAGAFPEPEDTIRFVPCTTRSHGQVHALFVTEENAGAVREYVTAHLAEPGTADIVTYDEATVLVFTPRPDTSGSTGEVVIPVPGVLLSQELPVSGGPLLAGLTPEYFDAQWSRWDRP